MGSRESQNSLDKKHIAAEEKNWERNKIMQCMCHLGGYTLIKRINPRQIYKNKEEVMEAQHGFVQC